MYVKWGLDRLTIMTSNAPLLTTLNYIHCDIPADQTLAEWRRELEAARRSERDAQRAERAARRRQRYFPRSLSFRVTS